MADENEDGESPEDVYVDYFIEAFLGSIGMFPLVFCYGRLGFFIYPLVFYAWIGTYLANHGILPAPLSVLGINIPLNKITGTICSLLSIWLLGDMALLFGDSPNGLNYGFVSLLATVPLGIWVGMHCQDTKTVPKQWIK